MSCRRHLFAASWTSFFYCSNAREGGRKKPIGRSKSVVSNDSRPGGCLLINPRGLSALAQKKDGNGVESACFVVRMNQLVIFSFAMLRRGKWIALLVLVWIEFSFKPVFLSV
jgi:hypothetical protein